MPEPRDINSYLHGELRKQLIALANANYHLSQLVRKALENDLNRDEIHSDAGNTKLIQWGNIGKLCDSIKLRVEEIEICIGLAEDAEKEMRHSG